MALKNNDSERCENPHTNSQKANERMLKNSGGLRIIQKTPEKTKIEQWAKRLQMIFHAPTFREDMATENASLVLVMSETH